MDPPELSFIIERHGAFCLGSKKAELHEWIVNVETGATNCITGRFRFLAPRAAKLNVKILAQQIAEKISHHEETPELKWHSAEKVIVQVGKIIPHDGPRATLEGRRKRFAVELQQQLMTIGWIKVQNTSPHTYELKG